jgi:ferredoxin-NADP reductase
MISRIISIDDETAGVRTFGLQPDKKITYLPGQWMYVSKDKLSDRRQFTISSAPTEKNISFTTKYTESDFKEMLWDLKEDDNLEIDGPHGNFFLDTKSNSAKLFLCGGMGVTPFRSMLRYACDNKLDQDTVLLYSSKTKADIVFEKELKDITAKVFFTLTHEEARSGYQSGKINSGLVKKTVPDYKEREWWVCGSSQFVDAMITLAAKMQVKQQVRSEDYPGY